jgi:hypothetical protein
MTWQAISARPCTASDPWTVTADGDGETDPSALLNEFIAWRADNYDTLPAHDSGHLFSGRGLHSFTLKLNLSNSRTSSLVKLGYTVDRRAQVELESEPM